MRKTAKLNLNNKGLGMCLNSDNQYRVTKPEKKIWTLLLKLPPLN